MLYAPGERIQCAYCGREEIQIVTWRELVVVRAHLMPAGTGGGA